MPRILGFMHAHIATSDQVVHALGGPTRRAIVTRLGSGPASVSQLARPLPIVIAGQHSQCGVQWCSLSAMSVDTVVPVVLFTFGVHRFLVERIPTGSGR